MNQKKNILGLFALSLIGFGIALVLKSSTELGLCLVSEPTCINNLTQVGNALFYSMQAIGLVFFILLFVPQAFNPWRKFAIWFLPLMFIYFAIYKNEGFFSIPEESVYRFLSIVYGVPSILIITWIVLRGKNKKS